MKSHLFFTFFLLLFSTSGFCQIENLDTIFNDWTYKDKPGGAVVVIKDGQVIYKKAFGSFDLKSKTPISLTSSFDLASIAKQFTATCIALLEEQGMLSKEDDIKKFYPQFHLPNNIKIKNLLDHTSGIREAYVLAILSGKVNLKGQVPKRYRTKEFLLKVLSKETDLNFEVGKEMVYTNVNYILLGDIVEKVSGQKLSVFADSAIFKPLKMNNTFFNDQESSFSSIGYHHNGKKFKKRTASGGIVGDHNLISTINDLVLWNNNFYKNTLGNKDPNLYEKLFTSSQLNNGESSDYGYGVFISDYKGYKQIYHGGDNAIHTSFMVRLPEKNLEVICLANSSRYDDTKNKAYKVVDCFLGDNSKKEPASEKFTFIDLDKEQLSEKAGLYFFIGENGLGNLRKVTLEENNLFISDHYNVKGLKLNAINENYLVAKNPLGSYIHITFNKDYQTNNIRLKEQYLNNPALQFQKCPTTKFHPKVYKGVYYNESTGARIKIKRKNKKIKARKGIIQIRLLVIQDDLFYAIHHDAVFIFDKNLSGEITSLKINAHDFRNFKLKKIK